MSIEQIKGKYGQSQSGFADIYNMVNVKGVTTQFEPVKTVKTATKEEVKSHQTDDERDANGKREDQFDQKQRPPMNDEELETVLKAIKNLSGVKDNHLSVTIELKGSIRMAIITDQLGSVVRRIPERDLWVFLESNEGDKKTGHLLDRAS